MTRCSVSGCFNTVVSGRVIKINDLEIFITLCKVHKFNFELKNGEAKKTI